MPEDDFEESSRLYESGQMSRRRFIGRLVAGGVSATAAIALVNATGPAAFASNWHRRDNVYGKTPGRYGNGPGQYGCAPGRYGKAPGQYGKAPGQYGRPPGHYGKAPGHYGKAPGNYGDDRRGKRSRSRGRR